MRAARNRELALVRPLGCCQQFFYLYSLALPVHFCLVAEIEGALDSAKLGAALEQVQTGIRRSGSALSMIRRTGPTFCRTNNPIELNVLPVDTVANWCGVVESELNLPFSTFPGPLMRATVLPASGGTSIILTFHHAIVDGLSERAFSMTSCARSRATVSKSCRRLLCLKR